MKQENYEGIKNSFFNSYKAFVDFIMVTNTKYGMYSVLLFKKKTYNNLVRVNIIIRNFNNDENMNNDFSASVTLNALEANNLIDEIRDNFKNNHIITYSTVNPRTRFQTLQNTKFSLNIKLEDEYELEKAYSFNDTIILEENRHKVRIK